VMFKDPFMASVKEKRINDKEGPSGTKNELPKGRTC
jgi:hypothetical protein